ncbi:MAG: Alpha N-terminal protein methyltransferase 1 [Vezdaea aestivalis]|nr:MAG: Alpha N-terminal protein methyltransferase 1 [Vezdaea aestivalis]
MASEQAEIDGQISHSDSISYWSNIPSTVNGMLGGFEELDLKDIAGSKTFLGRLRRIDPSFAGQVSRCVDCGAGIGRVTKGLLGSISDTVDFVEPIVEFTNEIESSEQWKPFRDQKKLGRIYNVGLESWQPEQLYDLIWIQWCVGHLTDKELVALLVRCSASLSVGGWIVLKENMSSDPEKKDIFDDEDSSVTRSHESFLRIFKDADLDVCLHELQRNFPTALYKVRMYGLRPKPSRD